MSIICPGAIGEPAPGRLGDVIGVSGNPLEDVWTLQHVNLVMKAGKVVKSGDQKSPQRFDMRSRDGARNQDPAGPRQRRSTRRD
jgi:hypothetical protein